MEELKRFPHLGEQIMTYLNPTTLRNFKKTSKDASTLVENARFFWIGFIQKRFARKEERIVLPDQWEKIVKRTPVNILRMLAVAYEKFSELHGRTGIFWGFLISKDFSYLQFDKDLSPLHIAAATGYLDLIKYIVGKINGNIPKGPDNGITPFHLAAIMGHLEVYKVLLDNFGEINPENKNGETPLHFAAGEGHLSICTFLFDKVLDKNPETHSSGEIPIGRAYQNDNMEVFLYMFENTDGEDDGKNPTTNRTTGNTLLHDAACNEDLETCRLIINNVSNKNPGNNLLKTPLHQAATDGNFEVFKLIFEKIDVKNPVDHDGKTPLDNAKTLKQWDNKATQEGKAKIIEEFDQ